MKPVTLRLDIDLVERFKSHAPEGGYQTEINRCCVDLWLGRGRQMTNEQLSLPNFPNRPNRRLGRSCIYCGCRATSDDHVPPKLVLKKPHPLNYRTVPSCDECNGGHSKDEEYFRAVLGISSFDTQLMQENLQGEYLDRMLTHSPQLDDRITSSLSVDENGQVYVKPELERMHRVCRKVACGLFALRYGAGRSLDSFDVEIVQHGLTDLAQELVAAMHYSPGLRAKRWTTVQLGAFSFLFAKGWFVSDPSIWCFVDFYQTIFAAIRCPSPPRSRLRIQLANRPW